MSPEKQMHPHPESDVTNEEDVKAKPQPGTQSGGPRDDALHGDAHKREKTLHRNQEELGVDREHKTDDMKKHHRGTYP
jgi:hypothetical protein